jgi:hypothetical protein
MSDRTISLLDGLDSTGSSRGPVMSTAMKRSGNMKVGNVSSPDPPTDGQTHAVNVCPTASHHDLRWHIS